MNKEVLYYVRYANGTLDIMNGLTYEVLSDFNGGSNIEILDEVPDYYQYQNICKCLSEEHRGNSNLLEENEKLKKQLEIAINGLKFISSQSYGKDMYDCAKGTLKQLEELDR